MSIDVKAKVYKNFQEIVELDDDDALENEDYLLALQMQFDEDEEDANSKWKPSELKVMRPLEMKTMNHGPSDLLDPQWELIDPAPDIRVMFQEFDKKYFWNSLGSCLVEWRFVFF